MQELAARPDRVAIGNCLEQIIEPFAGREKIVVMGIAVLLDAAGRVMQITYEKGEGISDVRKDNAAVEASSGNGLRFAERRRDVPKEPPIRIDHGCMPETAQRKDDRAIEVLVLRNVCSAGFRDMDEAKLCGPAF